CGLYFFFFSSRRRHTRSKRDWSSDVCSSDLLNIMASTTETQQRKKQSWHIRDPEIREEVRYCVTRRLTEKESLEELSNSGYDISYRTFRRIKRKLGPNKQRRDEIIKHDYLLHTI